ncbi:hypothetical protein ABZ570_27525 [Micromonospora sp. NPDC007271]|uniref:hypothetical protein n=1 Tax=Micromonospora sp. NPDC007271 TaxID=3154587 RepID=UPI0033CAD0ED
MVNASLTRARVVMLTVAVVGLLLVGAVVVVASRATAPQAAGDGSGTVTGNGLVLHHPQGASLRVPAGALPSGTRVRLEPRRAPALDRLGLLQPDGQSWEIIADHDPIRPVELTMPYDPGKVPPDTRPLVATFDDVSGWWLPTETVADPGNRRLVAQLSGFSFKTWILDRVNDAGSGIVSAASWLEYQSGRLLGSRATRPDCTSDPKPEWISQVLTVEDANAQIFACVGREGFGFDLNLVNNRGYPVAVDLDTPFAGWSGSLLDDGLSGFLQKVAAETGRKRVFLLPTGSAQVVYDPPATASGHLEGHARADGGAAVVWLAMEVAQQVGADLPAPGGKELGIWTIDCVVRMLGTAEDLTARDIAGAVSGMTGCLQHTLEHEVRLRGVDPDQELWKSYRRVPPNAQRAVAALRWLRAIEIVKWGRLAADMWVNDRGAAADLVDVSVWWEQAPGPAPTGKSVYLYTLDPSASAAGSSGQQVTGVFDGSTYPHSTGAWVGCEGTPATLTYQLGHGYRRLRSFVGLSGETPADVTARVDFTLDGNVVQSVEVSPDRSEPVDIDLSGVGELVVSAIKVAGECEVSDTPYGVLGDARLWPGADPATSSVPQAFVGTWRGQITQPNSPRSPYTSVVTLKVGAAGDQVGTVRYPELECQGTLTLEVAQARRLQVTEEIRTGSQCSREVNLDFRLLADGRMTVAFRFTRERTDSPIGWGTLTKVG